MGVTCVVPVPVPDGKSSQQVVDALQKKFEFLGATKVGSWNIDSDAYQTTQSIDGNFKLIYILHSSEQSHLTFSVLENNLCVVAETGFVSIISKLKAFYVPKKAGKIDVRGIKYELGDFSLKVGTITQTSNFKGILVEVEYKPCSDANQCWNLVQEFLTLVVEDAKPVIPTSLVDKKLNLFTYADTILQYHHLLTKKNT